MMQKYIASVSAMLLALGVTDAMAATPVNLSDQPASILSTFQSKPSVMGMAQASMVETSRNVDFNHTTHIRVRQTYAGYPVWGSDAVIHKPASRANTTMNGIFYRDLALDLKQLPAFARSKAQAEQASKAAISAYSDKFGAPASVTRLQSHLMVYIDNTSTAHWAYQVRFMTNEHHGMPSMPIFILDAATFKVLATWNDLKTAMEVVNGGGVGGNPTMGKQTYDGLSGHRPILKFSRDAASNLCYLKNDTVTILDARSNENPSFKCDTPDASHNNVYWNTLDDENNEGYSPNNDGVYSDTIVRQMYWDWFKVNMLEKNGKPQHVTFHVHDPAEGQNAYYVDGEMTFGEGDNESYPVVAPSVVAHEMSHGFTEQHSNLVYDAQSGGLNEAFSDMADKAVEYYVEGKNNWNIDPELLKPNGRLLRYMDDPTKDCDGGTPGVFCSIDNMKQYNSNIDVHYSSGIFNKAFTLIAGSDNWNTHKAFEVMVQANMNYWTANTTFSEAACGVIKATRDYKYDEKAIINAMKVVGVDTKKCK